MKSEIRQSTITALDDKVHKNKYGQYLKTIHINKLRGFENQTINFDFPVTALIGPNGGGKTTVLGACALLYKSMAPRNFFTKSQQFDLEMKNWSISYEALDRNTVKSTDTVKRTASFSRARWNRDALEREVLFFGISRTLPAVERRDLLKFADVHAAFGQEQINSLSPNAASCISRILGKDVSKFQEVHTQTNGEITLYTGKNDSGCTYSEFHFGAGESSVIRMVNAIEKISDNGLILIEEIENGLHPVAAIKVVEYLITKAAEKSLQVVFTTHSEHVISLLPNDAIWASLNGKLQQGKLDIMSLRTLVGDVSAKLIIFVEDYFAQNWVLSMLRSNKDIALEAISIYPMSGDGTAVSVQKNRKKDPSILIPSICVIDGDSKQDDDEELQIYRLCGEAPERYIFDSLMEPSDLM